MTRRYLELQSVVGPVALAPRPTQLDLEHVTERYEAYARNLSGARAELYAVWSPELQAYGFEYGLMSLRQSVVWRDLLLASPDWRVVYADQGTVLFHLGPSS